MKYVTNDKEARLGPGEYYITPDTLPEKTAEGENYWEVSGWRAWGGKAARIRKRRRGWSEANELLREYLEEDAEWRNANTKAETPVDVVAELLDDVRLAEVTRALALVPPLPQTHLPDPRFKLDAGIEFALACGWNPVSASDTVAFLSSAFQNLIKTRGDLPWMDPNHLAKGSVIKELMNQRDCVAIFGKETVASINSTKRQKEILESLSQNVEYPRKTSATIGLTRLLNHLVDTERLGIARIYHHGNKSLTIPEAMSIPEQQNYLDEFWDTPFAAAAVARLHLGVRPWSDLGKSFVANTVYGLSPDYATFLVRHDGKTGWRPVRTTSVAKKLFQILDQEGRLSRERSKDGYHIIYVGGPCSWSYHYGKLGYRIGAGNMGRNYPKLYATDPEAAVAKFRSRYPELYGKEFTPDFTRKTSITAYLNVSDGEMDKCATYHGNSEPVIEEHYRALMTRAASVLHYRLIPTALKEQIDTSTIELPDWCTISLGPAEQQEYKRLQDALPKPHPHATQGRSGQPVQSKSVLAL